MVRFTLIAVVCLILFPVTQAYGQRYEVGRRLVEFDKAWEKHRDSPRKKEATSQLLPVVPNFFAARWGEAGKLLDQARHTLISDKKPSDEVRWADSLQLQLNTRLLDPLNGKLVATLSPFYDAKLPIPKDALLKLAVSDGKKSLGVSEQTSIADLPVTTGLKLNDLPDGDHTLIAEIWMRKKRVVHEEHGLSIIRNAAQRIAKVRSGILSLPVKTSATEKATLQYLSQLLDAFAKGKTGETDYPCYRLLNECEAALQTLKKGETYYGNRRTGQYWLKLVTGKGSYVSRLFAPDEVKKWKPLPLVVALHGLGGSENLFFESYGDGYIVHQCRKRGWLLVSPRSPYLAFDLPVAEIVDEVAKLYPVDRKRVFVVGHSMGAAQAIASVQKSPNAFAAIAALGGSGRIKSSEGIKQIPFLVGVGNRDFAFEGAKRLATSLKAEGVKSVEFREYPNVEHIMIVREALPDVFGMFDEAAK